MDRGLPALAALMAAHCNHDEDRETPSIVFELGGRLDLPEDFSVAPLHLASPEELAEAARKAPILARLAAFVDWVDKGKRLGEDGDLEHSAQEELAGLLGLEPEEWIDADDDFVQTPYQSEVSLLTEWALVAGFVSARGQKLIRRAAGRAMHDDPLVAWRSAFDALLELGVVDMGGNGPPWGDTVDASISDVIVLANTAGEPLRFADVLERLCVQEQELLAFGSDDGDMTRGLEQAIADDAMVIIQRLVELGVVALDGEILQGTALGAWASVQLLEEDGFEVTIAN